MHKQINLKDAKCKSFEILAPVQLAKEKEEKGTFLIEAYTGAVVDRWWGKLAIDMAGMSAKNNIPVLRDHDSAKIVGSSDETWVDKSFFVSGKFSKVTDAAKEVEALANEGFPWQASIGVEALKIVKLENGAEMEVNGEIVNGPAEVWLETNVFETSFLLSGADSNTSVSAFSKFDEEPAPEDGAKQKPSIKGDDVMEITMAVLEKDAPALLEAIQADAKKEGVTLGATNERDRIKGVSEQNMVGHEALVSGLMYDGKTTGPEAAVQVLAAEKVIRGTAAAKLAADGVTPVVAVVPVDDGKKTIDPELPLDEQAKLTWDGDKALRNEFGSDFDSFKAFFEADKGGHVRILKSKREA